MKCLNSRVAFIGETCEVGFVAADFWEELSFSVSWFSSPPREHAP